MASVQVKSLSLLKRRVGKLDDIHSCSSYPLKKEMTVHILYQKRGKKKLLQERKLQRNIQQRHILTHRLYLYTLVLLRCEFVRTDGSDRDVGSHQSLVLEEEGQGIHPAEGRADHHHWG